MDLATQLDELEGRVKHAYQDHLGYWTIGVGRLIDKRKGGGLTDAEIDMLLSNDINSKTLQVYEALPWVKKLNEPRQAVVIGMAFQMGLQGLLGFRSTLSSMRDERWMDAAEGMRRSLWGKQTPVRVKLLARQMETGEWQTGGG